MLKQADLIRNIKQAYLCRYIATFFNKLKQADLKITNCEILQMRPYKLKQAEFRFTNKITICNKILQLQLFSNKMKQADLKCKLQEYNWFYLTL